MFEPVDRAGAARSRWGPDDEAVDQNSPACPTSGCFQSMLPPRFSQSTGVWMSYQTGFWRSICPLVHPMRRRKIARKTSSPKVRSLPRCGRFTLCYGMNPQRATRRKTIPILSLIMFKRIPWDQRPINTIKDDRQPLLAYELNVFDSCQDASGIDSIETVARMIHDESLRNR